MHTPTPIYSTGLHDHFEFRLYGNNNEFIISVPVATTYREDVERAQHIADETVTAINSHTALVEALEKILEGDTMHGKQGFTHADVIQEHYKIARKALETAKRGA